MKMQLLSILAAFTTSLVCACGGGTIGTGLGVRGAELAGAGGARQTALGCTLYASIKNSSGIAQQKATFRVTSSVNTYSCVTAANGSCSLEIRIVAGEPVSLSIVKNGIQYASQEYLSPAGESEISRTFVLREDRTIETRE
jgi:hypothetical protein